MSAPDVKQAFADYDRQNRIQNSKVGAVLAIILMPAGVALDYFVYSQKVLGFLQLRLLCSLLVGIVWLLFLTPFGKKHYRVLGMTWYMLPAFFIALMIYFANDPVSPYYAGLNIVLLAVGLILPWTYKENLLAVALVILMYFGAAFGPTHQPTAGPPQPVRSDSTRRHPPNYQFNNLYFLLLTGIVVVAGSFVHSRLRYREFELRFELDKNKKMLEESNQKLVELDAIKGRFFANISHELRTPLTLIISPLETILSRYSRVLEPDAVGLLQTMHGNGLRLLKLINDLLDLVRLDSGVMQVRRDPVALAEFLRGMASAARQVADNKGITLEVKVAPNVGVAMLDRDKLEKIVLNLQFNALKFTPTGGRVELRADREGEELVLRVSDTGIGIPAKDLPNVFGRFFQVDSSARRKYQGVGIGLALVKELVELHEGTVAVDSVEGQGTTFTARMPYLEAAAGSVSAPVPELQALPEVAQSPAEATPSITAAATGEPRDAAPATAPAPAPAGPAVSSEEWLSNLYHRANLFGAPVIDKTTARNARTEAPANGHAWTVLVADDQPDMLRFIKSELQQRYNVIEAVNGQEAVDRAAEQVPDIILLDMMMPEKDGIQACQEIRAAPATQGVPIIIITAHVDEQTKINALRAGASDFLPKPFSTTELHVRVNNLVDSHDFQRRLARQNETLEATIEKLKETESLLVQREKLASLGRLSAGIIHEINNPLNFATTGLYTLRSKARLIPETERDDFAEILKDVEEGISRVKTIVSDLRGFAYQGEGTTDAVDVREVVTSALRFLSQEWRDRVAITTSLTEGHVIHADKNKLIQVLINLLQNSMDAFKGKVFTDEKPSISISGMVEGELSLLRIRDNGEGIDPQVLDKIFDPFFTTKDVGEGMGLGLSICYRIVQGFGGRITVRSERGKFCEFTLEFPVRPPQSSLQP